MLLYLTSHLAVKKLALPPSMAVASRDVRQRAEVIGAVFECMGQKMLLHFDQLLGC
jgi:hypothetical protein